MANGRYARWYSPASVAAFFALFAVACTFPLARRPGSVIGAHGDSLFSVWRLAWVAHQLPIDPLRLFDANIFYPEPRTLAYSDAMLLPATLWAPLQWLGMDAVVAYNLALLLAFVLNGVSAYLLVAHLSGSRTAGVAGGLLFAFIPFRFDHFDHLELQLSFWMPLAVLAWHRGMTTNRPRQLLATAGFATAQVLSCIYYGIFLVTWIGVMTIGWSLRSPRAAVTRLAATLALPIAVLALYSLPYLENRDQLGERSARDALGWSAQPRDFLSATNTNVLYRATAPLGPPERHLFPGLVATLLAALGLWPLSDRVRRLHAASLLLGVLLVLGFNAFLYPLLYAWVLPYRGLRVPARAMILIVLSLSVLAGLGYARLEARLGRVSRCLLAVLVIGVMSLEYFARPALTTVDRSGSRWYATLATMPDAVVFEWPVSHPRRLTEMVDVLYMYRSTVHWRPLLNGYSGKYPWSYLRLLEEMRSFPDGNSIAHLQRAGATVLVVHEVPSSRPPFDDVLDRLARDPSVSLLAQHTDGSRRIAFLRLAPSRDSR